ncbi:MAG: CNNM domain-containing protein [Brevinematia bacterium]
MNENILNIFLLVFFVVGSAFSSFAELSLFIVDKVRLQKLILKNKKKSKYIRKLLKSHRETLITILFFNLLFNTSFTIVASNLLISFSVITSTIFISLTITLFGEFLPKVVGFSLAERFSLEIARIVYFMNFLGKVFFRFIDKSIISPFLKAKNVKTNIANFFDILKRNVKDERLRNFVDIINFDAKDIMIPASEVAFLPYDVSKKVVGKFFDKLSNYPYAIIYDSNRNNVIGFVKFSDLIKSIYSSENLRNYLNIVYFVPETKKVYSLIREESEKNISISIVVDEYGNIIGVISPEVILSYVFLPYEYIKKESEKVFIIKGELTIKEFNNYFATNIDSQFYNTISGFVIEKLGKIPNEGEVLNYDNMEFKVKEVKDGKIEEIIVKFD